MEEVIVRRAHLVDLQAIVDCLAIAFETHRNEYSIGAYRRTVLQEDAVCKRLETMNVFVATTSDGEVVGTLSAAIANEEGQLRGMAVKPEWQGRGVARKLMSVIEKDLANAGCRKITLGTTTPLRKAIRLYESLGYVQSGAPEDFDGMPLYNYVKLLNTEAR
jgi:ribosomal protein S18 acetylase RimI-like enzyme